MTGTIVNSIMLTLRKRGLMPLVLACYGHLLQVLWVRILKKRYFRKKIYDYQMVLDLEDKGLSRTLMLFGERELDHKILLEKICESGMHVLDIGANIGYYALMELKLIGQNGRLFAVEPSSENVALLQRNLRLNRCENQVEVRCNAVSNRRAKQEFFLSEKSNLNTFHLDHLSEEKKKQYRPVEVESITIQDIVSEWGGFDLLRMDVEGHEVEILASLQELICKNIVRPTVIFETHINRYKRSNVFQNTLHAFVDAGYRFSYVSSSSAAGSEKLKCAGYQPEQEILTDEYRRGIFRDVHADDAIRFITETGGIRTVVLDPQ